MKDEIHNRGGRGQSEVVGVVLLLGLVIVGALVVLVSGSTVVSDVQQQQSDEGASVVVQEVDSKLQSLSGAGDAERKSFTIDEALPKDLKLKENAGFLDLRVNKRASCTARVSLDTIRQTNNDGEVVGLQAGGVWTQSPGGDGSALVAGPDVTFENGSLDVSVANMTGNIDKGNNQAVRNVSRSRNRTEDISTRLFSGSCSDLDNVTITVNSEFSGAWETYLVEETGASPSQVTRINDTAFELFVPESSFPRRVDNDRNRVVNLSNPSYMDQVSVNNGAITIDKNAGNDYRVFMSALDSYEPNIGGIREVGNNISGVIRRPKDFVVIIDVSGSMGGSKIDNARAAARTFVGLTEFDKGDRIALMKYDRWPQYLTTSGQYFSSDGGALNNTINNEMTRRCNLCQTDFADALQHANALLDLRSNSNTRDKQIVLLTDGKSQPGAAKCDYYDDRIDDPTNPGPDDIYDPNGSPTNTPNQCLFYSNQSMPGNGERVGNLLGIRYANDSEQSDITLHTIGFGGGVNETILKIMKNQTTGGTYSFSSTNVADIKQVFREIATNASNSREVIALDPISTNVSTGNGLTTPPQIPGDTSRLAVETSGSKQFLNINDPAAPSKFSHALSVSGGTKINISAYSYSCNEWRGTGQTRTNSTTGNSYPVIRCTNMTAPKQIKASNVTLITDASNIKSTVQNNSAWWQQNITDALNDSQIYNASTGDYELESNEALALLEFNTTGKAKPSSVLPVVFRIGRPESGISSEDIINVGVSEVKIED